MTDSFRTFFALHDGACVYVCVHAFVCTCVCARACLYVLERGVRVCVWEWGVAVEYVYFQAKDEAVQLNFTHF